MIIDLSLKNHVLYNGCAIENVGGRDNLTTPIGEAITIVGKNIHEMVITEKDRDVVMLTGPMAVWAYLIVFHAVVHSFRRVYYNDGKNGDILIAAHG